MNELLVFYEKVTKERYSQTNDVDQCITK